MLVIDFLEPNKKFVKFFRHHLFGWIALAELLLFSLIVITGHPFWLVTGQLVFFWFLFYLFLQNQTFFKNYRTVKATILNYWVYFLIRILTIALIFALIGILETIDKTEQLINFWWGSSLVVGLTFFSRLFILKKLIQKKETLKK